MTEPSWDHYRAALAVLEEGSLSGAARALGLTQPTLGRQIAALERSLGVALFTRSPAGLAPTEAALILAPYAQSLKATAEALRRAVTAEAEGLSGRVRITASEVVGAEVLPPILAALHARHPRLAVDVVLTDRMQDLLRRDADIAVRMAPPTQEALVARRVGTIRLGLYGHRRYLDRCGVPERPADLARHSVIGFDAETPFLRAMMRAAPALGEAGFAWRSDSTLAQLAALRAGFGLGACHTVLAGRDPNLIRVLPEIVWELPTFVAMHEDLRALRRCRVVFDALAEGMAAYCAE
ncbi:LysR family transcriptional regulator [Methylobacterium frigidaeris]|uniref:HTH-type transcriptional regulator HdfR n=1 Tax=Methylobacterium frigidaeris TaxID=2038277 RepID=A0AA37HGD0_9HYPH|nr:LysR family transcriptional regulator [Methylobacterium frigidaeris]PIK69453.1 LysR family transcriptional regulator [Methylobacterium frigidaeris]GJD65248.1 HTH-type transcriptional regulator HdfR [Methylobacterium frigidaeris]